jgi:hypothetical protein
MMIVIGSVFFGILNIGATAPFIGFAAWFAGLAYFTAFYFEIIVSTVNGNDECPGWPDITDILGDIIMPVLRSFGVLFLSFLPMMVVLGSMGDVENRWGNPLVWVAIVWGAFYFPMAILNVVVGNEMAGALPHRVLPAIVRAMPRYLLLAALLASVFILSRVAVVFGAKIPFFGGLLSAGISLYFMMVQARLAGTFYLRRMEAEHDEEEDELQASPPPETHDPRLQDTKEISL